MKLPLILGMLLTSSILQAQLKSSTPCAAISIDWLTGKVNGVAPDYNMARVQAMLPCFKIAEEETDTSRCGGIIQNREQDIRIFTGRNYIEVGEKFKGKQSIPLLGMKKSQLFTHLGNPRIRDTSWEAYQTSYGCMVLYFSKAGTVNRIQFSTEGTDGLQLCQ